MACSGLAVVEFAALILRSRRCARSLPDVSLLSLDLHRGWLKAARASLRWRLPAFLGLPSSPRRTSPVAHSLLHTRPLLAVWQIEGVSCMQVVGVCDALQRRSSTTHVLHVSSFVGTGCGVDRDHVGLTEGSMTGQYDCRPSLPPNGIRVCIYHLYIMGNISYYICI